MEISKSLPTTQSDATLNANPDREQAMRNAINTFQARYGEKPKEARAVKKQLDKDDFMKIMLTEMKHQDPTKPMDADKMATQMAQLTSVEQLKNVSASIDKLVEKNNASDRLAMSAMIGRTVTVDKGRFSHTKGIISPISYTLPENASKIKLTVQDEHGEEVFSQELEAQKAGANVFNWDGLANNRVAAKSAAYTVRIDAENEKGVKMKIDPIEHENIVGVSFDGGDTNFLVGNPKSPQKIPMRNVIKIEGDSMLRANQKPKQVSENGEAAQKENQSELPEELRQKVEAEQAARGMAVNSADNSDGPSPQMIQEAMQAAGQMANAQSVARAPKATESDEVVKPEGFANGLHE